MPSQEHEVLAEMFRESPGLVIPLLARFGVSARGLVAGVDSETFSSRASDFRADAAIVLRSPKRGRATLVVVVEVQLACDPAKRTSWPLYEALARARHGTQACVLVVTPAARVARWARRAVVTGPSGSRFLPLVLGPDRIPAITSGHVAPELALLSAMAHAGDSSRGEAIATAAIEAFLRLDDRRAAVYWDVLLRVVAQGTRRRLEVLMQTKYEFTSKFAREHFALGKAEGKVEGKAEGKAEGEAESLLVILEARGLSPTADQRERISSCRDSSLLRAWLKRAATAATIDEVLAQNGS